MIHMITGGSGSGKSAFAEGLLVSYRDKDTDAPLIYIATMVPYGEETKRKIIRHRGMRAGKGFQTLECYQNLKELAIPENSGILLECLSNLTANEMYMDGGAKEDTKNAVIEGIRHLTDLSSHVVVVTNEVNSDINGYSQETKAYQKALGTVNVALAAMADRVTEVVYGIPITVK